MPILAQARVIKNKLLTASFSKYILMWPLHGLLIHTTAVRMRAKLIDGLKIAKAIRAELSQEVEYWVVQGHRRPQLTVICVGNDLASAVYIRNKTLAAREVGIDSRTITFSTEVTEEELLNKISNLNVDSNVDGILVQLPLPVHISERTVCNAVLPEKDVDGFNAVNVGRFCLNMEAFVPCTALGVVELLRRAGIQTCGKHAVVCGRSKNVGLPIAMLLHAGGFGRNGGLDSTTTICHRHTSPDQLALLTRSADIIVAATGVPNLIKSDMVKKGACVIDVGITRIIDPDGKKRLVGDVDYEGVCEIAGYVTRVPGGVGPMTVTMLMKNTLMAAKKVIQLRDKTFQGRRTC